MCNYSVFSSDRVAGARQFPMNVATCYAFFNQKGICGWHDEPVKCPEGLAVQMIITAGNVVWKDRNIVVLDVVTKDDTTYTREGGNSIKEITIKCLQEVVDRFMGIKRCIINRIYGMHSNVAIIGNRGTVA